MPWRVDERREFSWSKLYHTFSLFFHFDSVRTPFLFDNRCGSDSIAAADSFAKRKDSGYPSIRKNPPPHYWASEKLFLFVFNESIRRVVDKSSELNKRSILPYRIKWNWMLPAPDLSSLKLTSLVGGLASWRLRFFLKQRNPRGWHAEIGSFPDSFSREPLNLNLIEYIRLFSPWSWAWYSFLTSNLAQLYGLIPGKL